MIKLNVGSGYKRILDYLNLDDDPSCNPDILINLDDKNLRLPFDDNTVDSVICHHFFEHVREFIPLLQELYRVSKPGTLWDVRVPHYNHEISIIDCTHVRQILPETFRLFSKKHNKLEIERNGSSSTLGLKYNIDLEIVNYDYVYDPYYNDIVPKMTQEMTERLFREALNTTMESHTILMVIKDDQ
jgi:ubiquinone/menaquinone biosynthesis C-methylase UbiE